MSVLCYGQVAGGGRTGLKTQISSLDCIKTVVLRSIACSTGE